MISKIDSRLTDFESVEAPLCVSEICKEVLIPLSWLFFGVKFGYGFLITNLIGGHMAKQAVPDSEGGKAWVLTQTSFRRFLEWLDSGIDSGGQTYLQIRGRLVYYFERKNCLSPDDLADETLNRVARRLEEEGEIKTDTSAHYCYIVAQFVFLESLRKRERSENLDDRLIAAPDASEGKEISQLREECLQRCMQDLEPDERDLITGYYQGSQRAKIENRRAIAAKLGLTINALSIGACRIRAKLEIRMQKYLRESE